MPYALCLRAQRAEAASADGTNDQSPITNYLRAQRAHATYRLLFDPVRFPDTLYNSYVISLIIATFVLF